MEKKQTAVDWLQAYLPDVNQPEYFRRAKEMEKLQMFDFAKAFYRYASGPDSGAVYDEDIQRFCDKYWNK